MRKVIQVATCEHGLAYRLVALCDDGTLWERDDAGTWLRMAVPNPEEDETSVAAPEYSEPAPAPEPRRKVFQRSGD